MNKRNIKSPEYYSHRKIGAQRTEMCSKFLWTQTTVKRLLQNEIYTGTLVNHKTVTSKIYKTKTFVPESERYRHENFLPQIIDNKTWEKTQFLLKQRPKANVRSTDGRSIHRYCGMIKCKECGAILIAKRRKYADGTEWVEYTCNSHHRYGKEYCTPHRIREEQLDKIVVDELLRLKDRISENCEKYDKIIKKWLKDKPKYEQKIQRYTNKISKLKNQIENLIMDRINDREHTQVYNDMIQKREEEIAELDKKVKEFKEYDKVCKHQKEQLKNTTQILDDMLSAPKISDSNIRILIEKIFIHQNEDKSIEVSLEFNGHFEDNLFMNIDEKTS